MPDARIDSVCRDIKTVDVGTCARKADLSLILKTVIVINQCARDAASPEPI